MPRRRRRRRDQQRPESAVGSGRAVRYGFLVLALAALYVHTVVFRQVQLRPLVAAPLGATTINTESSREVLSSSLSSNTSRSSVADAFKLNAGQKFGSIFSSSSQRKPIRKSDRLSSSRGPSCGGGGSFDSRGRTRVGINGDDNNRRRDIPWWVCPNTTSTVRIRRGTSYYADNGQRGDRSWPVLDMENVIVSDGVVHVFGADYESR